MDSIKIEVDACEALNLDGKKVGHKADPSIPDLFVGYANTDKENVTVLVPMSRLLRVQMIERKATVRS